MHQHHVVHLLLEPGDGAVLHDAQGMRQHHQQGHQPQQLADEQLEEIAKTKMKDLTAADLDAAVRTIAGSARSMGVTVEGV